MAEEPGTATFAVASEGRTATVRRKRRAETGASPRRPGRRSPPPMRRRPRRLETGASPRAPYRRRRRRVAGIVTLVVVVLAVPVTLLLGDDGGPTDTETIDGVPVAGGGEQPTLTVVTVADGDDGAGRAAAIAVLTVDRSTGAATVLLVPTATVADVPGYGTFRLGEAFGFGGASLVGVTVDNLLGIRADEVVTVTADGWARLADAAGGIEVNLSRPVVERGADGEGQVVVPEGVSTVSGAPAGSLLTPDGTAGSELDVLPRIQAGVLGLLDRIAAGAGPDVAAAVPDAVDAATPELVAAVLAELAEARGSDALTTLTLPVSPLGSGEVEVYRADAGRLEAVVAERFAGARPDPEVAGGRELQVLNGNGRPGVGAAVAEILGPAGYRILLTGNADRFTYEVTRIVVHDDDPATLAAARDIRDRLGVGEVERSGTPQSVADVTIVVGTDFGTDDELPPQIDPSGEIGPDGEIGPVEPDDGAADDGDDDEGEPDDG